MPKSKGKPKANPYKPTAPRYSVNPDSYLAERPLWSFRRMDLSHPKWSIGKCPDVYGDIIEKLRAFEGMTWGEIIGASGGRSHGTNNHFNDVSSFCKAARDRLIYLRMEDYDRLFSIRLSGTKRLYGILEQGVFFIVWYDPDHEVYPTQDK